MTMNGSTKPLASLSAALLARKGSARPAMRPPGFFGVGSGPAGNADADDDLGWNDMGEENPVDDAADAAPIPAVLLQRDLLQGEIGADGTAVAATPLPDLLPAKAPRGVSMATATRIGRETHAKHAVRAKSAFTLRLDTDRHLRLRLASALQNRSAQLLIIEALDAFLETLPEVGALVRQLPDRAQR